MLDLPNVTLRLLSMISLLTICAQSIRVEESSGPVVVCAVSANQPTSPTRPTGLQRLVDECMKAESKTEVVLFMIQDYADAEFPSHVRQFVRQTGAELRLSDKAGRGRGCKNPDDASKDCGTVWVVAYSSMSVMVTQESEPQKTSPTLTGTTAKGTVVVKLDINNRKLVVASTHGAEGVRAKKKGSNCTRDTPPVSSEWNRVEDFRTALASIAAMRTHKTDGVLWGGDFNPRTVWRDGPKKGCPMWPDQEGVDLRKMQDSSDILGVDRSHELVTFSDELQGGIVDAGTLPCPTYKKEALKDNGGQFSCSDSSPMLYYKTSHPPSWTDRIYHSSPSDSSWLTCSSLKRVANDDDHDAVFVMCTIAASDE